VSRRHFTCVCSMLGGHGEDVCRSDQSHELAAVGHKGATLVLPVCSWYVHSFICFLVDCHTTGAFKHARGSPNQMLGTMLGAPNL
jgi:hypothetical protein